MSPARARAALALVCTASVATLAVLGSRLTFFGDDWAFLLQRPGWGADALLDPHNGHLSVLAVVITKTLVALFGLDAQLPFRLVLGAAVAAVGALVYVLVAQRAGRLPGLVAATLIVFLGPAWEDLLWTFQIGFVGSLAAGLGALLALERDTPRRNAVACGLLVASIALSDLAIPMIAAAAVAVALRRRPVQAWIPLAPLALFGLWFETFGGDARSELSASNLPDVPRYVLDCAASGLASLTGVTGEGWFDVPGRVVLALAVAGFGLWYARDGRSRDPSALVFAAGALTFWILAGANYIPGREPDASRYQLVHAVFLVLIAAALVGPLHLGRGAATIALALAAVALGSNLSALSAGDKFMREHAANARAALGALEIARPAAPPELRLTEQAASDPYLVSITAGRYYAERDRHGTPAFSPAEIAGAPAHARRSADAVLAAAYGLRLRPGDRAPRRRSGCRRGTAVVLPPGSSRVINLRRKPVVVGLRRFADPRDALPLGELPRAARLEVPRDGVATPFHLVGTGAALQVCPA